MANAKGLSAVVVVAVRGGEGEDGSLQEMLADAGVPYTGSSANITHICHDKVTPPQTSTAVRISQG